MGVLCWLHGTLTYIHTWNSTVHRTQCTYAHDDSHVCLVLMVRSMSVSCPRSPLTTEALMLPNQGAQLLLQPCLAMQHLSATAEVTVHSSRSVSVFLYVKHMPVHMCVCVLYDRVNEAAYM
jgi:hypothetical protein